LNGLLDEPDVDRDEHGSSAAEPLPAQRALEPKD
jgi:hypothetical protein